MSTMIEEIMNSSLLSCFMIKLLSSKYTRLKFELINQLKNFNKNRAAGELSQYEIFHTWQGSTY